jgi:hypothetical protein
LSAFHEVTFSFLSFRLEHIRLHEKHRGHESMHAEMVLILFATLVISQIALVKWRQVYPRSYHVSLFFQFHMGALSPMHSS